MTIPRKGSRTLTVGGRLFRYIVKEHHEELVVTVQEDVQPTGRVMQFYWPSGHSVLPSDVEYTILQALNSGWNPRSKGSAYRGSNPRSASIANDE